MNASRGGWWQFETSLTGQIRIPLPIHVGSKYDIIVIQHIKWSHQPSLKQGKGGRAKSYLRHRILFLVFLCFVFCIYRSCPVQYCTVHGKTASVHILGSSFYGSTPPSYLLKWSNFKKKSKLINPMLHAVPFTLNVALPMLRPPLTILSLISTFSITPFLIFSSSIHSLRLFPVRQTRVRSILGSAPQGGFSHWAD